MSTVDDSIRRIFDVYSHGIYTEILGIAFYSYESKPPNQSSIGQEEDGFVLAAMRLKVDFKSSSQNSDSIKPVIECLISNYEPDQGSDRRLKDDWHWDLQADITVKVNNLSFGDVTSYEIFKPKS